MKKKFAIAVFSCLALCFAAADTKYKVEKGDTLYSISRKYQITVAELRAANNLSDEDVIKIGQTLTIPSADISNAVALSSSSSGQASAHNTREYTVQKGDTLYGIARKNGITVAELLSLNNLDSSAVIKVGQKIKIKDSSSALPPTATVATSSGKKETVISDASKAPDTRTYGTTVVTDSTIAWPVQNPTVTQVRGKVSGVQLSAQMNESVTCIREGTVMYVGVYRGFGQVLFVQSQAGMIYAYTGLGSVKVKKGDYVVSGAEVGTAGVDSISGKPQITFMVFQNGQPVDPVTAPRS